MSAGWATGTGDLLEDLEGWNCGVVCGRGLAVLDIDPRNGGSLALADLLCSYELPNTWCVKTGGGGWHYYYSVPAGTEQRSGNRLKAQGLELKGLGSFVVGPGSLHPSGLYYEWAPGCSPEEIEIAPLPEWLVEELCTPLRVNPEALQVASPQVGSAVARSRVLSALAALPADNYEDWLAVGMALHSAGFSVQDWHDWSSKSDSYNPEIIDKKWASFRPGGGRGLGTIFQLAEGRGWQGGQDGRIVLPTTVKKIPARSCELQAGQEVPRNHAQPYDGNQQAPHHGDQKMVYPSTPHEVNESGSDIPADVLQRLEGLVQLADAAVSMRPFLVEGLLVMGSSAMLYGGPYVGKSQLAKQLSICIAAGLPFLGRETERGGVLYVATEDELGVQSGIIYQCKKFGIEVPKNLYVKRSIYSQNRGGPDPLDIQRLIEDVNIVSQEKIRLIIIDTLCTTFTSFKENDNNDMGKLLSGLDQVAEETGACILLIHHPSKHDPRSERGASAIRGALHTSICMYKGDNNDEIKLEFMKIKNYPSPGIIDLFMERTKVGEQIVTSPSRGERVYAETAITYDPQIVMTVSDLVPLSKEGREERIKEYISMGLSQRGMAGVEGCPRSEIQEILKKNKLSTKNTRR